MQRWWYGVGEYGNLLLLVQILQNPGFRGNKLGGWNAELHELRKCGREATSDRVVSVWNHKDTVRRDLLLEEHILVLRVLESILLERLVTDQGIVGTGGFRVNSESIVVLKIQLTGAS